MEMIQLEVNGVAVEVPKGSNLLVAAKAANIKIPTLCYHPDLKPGASCGICVVRQLVPSRTEPGKFVPSPKLLRACCTEAMPGMKIITHDPDIVQVRRTVLELILANHPNDCLQCPRSGSCELQALAADFGIRAERAVRFRPDPVGVRLNYETVSDAVSEMRACGSVRDDWKVKIQMDFEERGEQ